MALTDGMLGLIGAGVLVYFVFYTSKVRWMRIIGGASFMVISIGFGAIADTALMYIPSMFMMLTGLLKIIEEAVAMTR